MGRTADEWRGIGGVATITAVAVCPPVRGTYFRNSMQMCAARRDVCFDFLAKKDEQRQSQSSTNERASPAHVSHLPLGPR